MLPSLVLKEKIVWITSLYQDAVYTTTGSQPLSTDWAILGLPGLKTTTFFISTLKQKISCHLGMVSYYEEKLIFCFYFALSCFCQNYKE